MEVFHKMYIILFNAITDALEHLEQGDMAKAKQELMEGQLKAEDIFIECLENDEESIYFVEDWGPSL